MMQKNNRYGIYEVDHTKFGGLIYQSDFNTDYIRKDNAKGSTIASRIAKDQRFDQQCQKNVENIRRKNNAETCI